MAGNPSLPDPRARGLARLLELPATVSRTELRECILARASDVGTRLADEAAVNDDVFDANSAAAYLDVRLSFLTGILPEEALPEIRRAFRVRTDSW